MSYVSVVLADTPRAFWQLGELSGTTAFDSSGNGYNATYTGTYTLGVPGVLAGSTCAQFDGSTGVLQAPYTFNYTTFTAFSLEYWINISGVWSYVVVTASNTTGVTLIYLNGSIVSSVVPSAIEVGALLDFGGSYQTVLLDEIAAYNYALTAQQVQNHFNASGQSPTTNTAIPFPAFVRRTYVFPNAKRRGS